MGSAPCRGSWAGGGRDGGVTAPSEVVVTWVEQGEQWEARKSATLQVQGSHTIEADDLGKAAAFVLPFDPSVRGLSSAITTAMGASGEDGVDPSARAAIAARETIRSMGIRITADTEATPAGTRDGPPPVRLDTLRRP